nr:hypothetical protein [Tanacetum cinerariifolium]
MADHSYKWHDGSSSRNIYSSSNFEGITAIVSKLDSIGIVKNVLVKIDKFLFPSDFVVIDMLNTHIETMIFRRPFLATIHAKIDVFNKEISLGIGDDRATFDMYKKIHNFMTPVGKEQRSKKARMLKSVTNTLSTHFCKHVKQIYNEILKKKHKGDGLSFPEFLLVRYEEAQGNDLIWDNRGGCEGRAAVLVKTGWGDDDVVFQMMVMMSGDESDRQAQHMTTANNYDSSPTLFYGHRSTTLEKGYCFTGSSANFTAVASLCISSGNLSSLAVGSCSGSRNSSLPVGTPCVFYSQQSFPKLDAPTAIKFPE